MTIEMAAPEFEQLVDRALAQVPAELMDHVQNCALLVEDAPPPDQAGLLGLYVGVPLTERGEFYAGVLPDRIFIYRLPILALCQTHEEVVEQVHVTVVHEIAHHFGIDDDRLRDLGYA